MAHDHELTVALDVLTHVLHRTVKHGLNGFADRARDINPHIAGLLVGSDHRSGHRPRELNFTAGGGFTHRPLGFNFARRGFIRRLRALGNFNRRTRCGCCCCRSHGFAPRRRNHFNGLTHHRRFGGLGLRDSEFSSDRNRRRIGNTV